MRFTLFTASYMLYAAQPDIRMPDKTMTHTPQNTADANVFRIICWGCFLLLNYWVWGLPLEAVYLPEQAGLGNIVAQFFAQLLFTGFLVVVAFEYLRKCHADSHKRYATLLLIVFSILLPATYFYVCVVTAHTDRITSASFFAIWFGLIGLAGFLISGRSPTRANVRITLSFSFIGLLVYAISSIGWSYVYGRYLKPSYLDWYEFIASGGGVLVWAMLVVVFVLLSRTQARPG